MIHHPTFRAFLFALCLLVAGRAAAQQTTAFTYQGQLRDGGTNANGTYGLTFKLFDAVTNGNQVGGTLTSSALLVNGLFSVNLDFGSAFDGGGRWLDIIVQAGTNAPETLAPRVQVLPAPYALYAGVAGTVTNGAITDAKIVTVSGSKVSGMVTNAASLTNGIWSVTVASSHDSTNGFFIFANGSVVMGMAPDGVSVQGVLDVIGNLQVDGNISTDTDVFARSVKLTSDRNAKEKFASIDSRAVLERVTGLPITSWSFKTDPTTRHIGPMAQDFHAAFNLGTDDKHIATVDEVGVALAAIQGLHEIVKEKDAEIATLKQRLTDLEKAVNALAKQKGVTP